MLESDTSLNCETFATKYAHTNENVETPAIYIVPPPCEMESAVYGQCMANLLDAEVRRNWRKWVDSAPVSVHIDSSRCNYTIKAFEKCLSENPNAGISDAQTSNVSPPEYYWMSSIYWQAPKQRPPPH